MSYSRIIISSILLLTLLMGIAHAQDLDLVESAEDGNIDEYEGNLTNFTVASNQAINGTQSIETQNYNGDNGRRAITDINEFPNASQGSNLSAHVRTDSGNGRVGMLFAVQDETNASQLNSYLVDVQISDDEILLFRLDDGSRTSLDSSAATVSRDHWYQVDVEWKNSGQIDVDVVNESTSNTVASVSASDNTYTDGGIGWHIDGQTSNSITGFYDEYRYNFTNNIKVWNETNADNRLEEIVTARFFGEDEIQEKSSASGGFNTSDINIAGTIRAEFQADNHATRTMTTDNISKEQDIFMLDTSVGIPNDSIRFTLTDRTGQFEGNEPIIIIEKPINKNDSTKYRVLDNDEFGTSGHTTTLENDVRYKIKVTNADGDTRVLGKYTAPTSETVNLEITNIEIDPIDRGNLTYKWNATQINDSGTQKIKFRYNDSQTQTEDLNVTIHERGDENNVLFTDQNAGPVGVYTADQSLTSSEEEKTWVVEWNATRNGTNISAEIPVGQPHEPVVPTIPDIYKHTISLGLILIIGGLFSQHNAEIGALTMSFVGAIFWWMSWLPSAVGGGVVFLAMATGALFYVKSTRGGF